MVPLEMEWRHLLFENWPVGPAVVDAHLPDPLTVDEHDDRAWLSVVPFANAAVRPAGLPARVGLHLPELNLRTYVTHDGTPAVYFFSLDTEGLLGVAGARLLQHLPYYYARISLTGADDGVRFVSHRRHPGARPAAYEATYRPTGSAFDARDDPLARFLVERYRFYTETPDGSLRYADIDHDPWTLHPATVDVSTNTLFTANGFRRPASDPTRYYSPGLDVTASRSKSR
jgi:uncharacterized protein YqjF (DUF2071 family)